MAPFTVTPLTMPPANDPRRVLLPLVVTVPPLMVPPARVHGPVVLSSTRPAPPLLSSVPARFTRPLLQSKRPSAAVLRAQPRRVGTAVRARCPAFHQTKTVARRRSVSPLLTWRRAAVVNVPPAMATSPCAAPAHV